MDFKSIFALFLLLNALFWGLFTHKTHCQFVSYFGITNCPPHWIHVFVMGLGSFILALFVQQDYIKNLII